MPAFADRIAAGRELAAALLRYRDEDPVVLALPRGGVPVAAEIASALHAPLDLVLVRKVGLPWQPEVAMGAVVDGPEPVVVRNTDVTDALHVSEAEFEERCKGELAEIERRRLHYLGGRRPAAVTGRTAIIVDDGIATGATMEAAIRAVRKRAPRAIVVAVPAAPAEIVRELAGSVDDVVCLVSSEVFDAVGSFYADFHQITDDDVIGLLAQFPSAKLGA